MTLVRTTIKTATKVFVSVDLFGYGSDITNFSVAKTTLQILPENFPSFHGTQEEWDEIMNSTVEIKTENIGHT